MADAAASVPAEASSSAAAPAETAENSTQATTEFCSSSTAGTTEPGGSKAEEPSTEAKKLVSPSASRSQGRKNRRTQKKRSPQKASGRKARETRGRKSAKALPGPLSQPSNLVAPPIVRDRKAIYSYGNYDPYYKFRFDRFAEVDPRVQALLECCGTEIFADKVVLDVGCNSGFITFLVAALGCRRVEGVDVDLTLITRALKHLRWLKQKGHKTMPEAPEESEKTWHKEKYAMSCVQGRGHVPYHTKPLRAGALQEAISKAKKMEKAVPSMPSTAPRSPDFPHNIEFRAENFYLSQLGLKRKTSYDVVLLLKITKWIHIMYGDVGIQELFAKCHQLLRLGGLLVLEAQTWQKYLEQKHEPPKRRGAHHNLMLRPDRFSELLGQQGFERQMSVSPNAMSDPMVIFRKVAKVQAESPPLMAELFQEQQFLLPRTFQKPPKVVPPRKFQAESSTGPSESPEGQAGTAQAATPAAAVATNDEAAAPAAPVAIEEASTDAASITTEAPSTVEDPNSPPAKRPRTEGE